MKSKRIEKKKQKIKQQPSFTTDPDPSYVPHHTPGRKRFDNDHQIPIENSNSQQSNFTVKSEPDCNPYQHYQTTIPPEYQPTHNLVGSKLFNDVQQPLESSGELAQRLDQLSKIVTHLVVNIQDNTNGLKALTETLLQPTKMTGELIKGQKFPVTNIEEIISLEEKLRDEPEFRSTLVSFSVTRKYFVMNFFFHRFIVYATNV